MDAETTYLFRHGVLRDAAYELMPPSLRTSLHGLVADCLLELFKARLESVAGGIADHLEHAGAKRLKELVKFRTMAAKHAERNFANEEAIDHLYLLAALKGLGNRERVEALERANGLQIAIGDREGAIQSLAMMHDLVSDDPELALIELSTQAKLDMRQGRTQEAAEAYEKLIAAYAESGDKKRELLATGNLNNVRKTQGRLDEAEALCIRTLELAAELGDRSQECRTLANLATLHGYREDYEKAEDYCLQALKQSRELNDRITEGASLNTLALLQRRQNRLEEAEQTYLSALAVLRETGSRTHIGVALGNYGTVVDSLGRQEEARDIYEQAIAMHRRTGNRRFEGVHLGSLAILEQRLVGNAQATARMKEAIAIMHEVGDEKLAAEFEEIRSAWID